MRDIINHVLPLLEGIAYKGHGFVIVSNPSVSQIRAMMEKASHNEGLRAVLDGNTLYVWDGYFMNHDEANEVLGVDDDADTPKMHLRGDFVELDVANLGLDDWKEDDDDPDFAKRVVTSLGETIRTNRIIRALYGADARIMVDDGTTDKWFEDYLGSAES